METYYCPEHQYTPPDNSGIALCPQCELAPRVGDRVTYADVNLSAYRGTLLEIARQTNGGNCLVRWEIGYQGIAEECLNNLREL